MSPQEGFAQRRKERQALLYAFVLAPWPAGTCDEEDPCTPERGQSLRKLDDRPMFFSSLRMTTASNRCSRTAMHSHQHGYKCGLIGKWHVGDSHAATELQPLVRGTCRVRTDKRATTSAQDSHSGLMSQGGGFPKRSVPGSSGGRLNKGGLANSYLSGGR